MVEARGLFLLDQVSEDADVFRLLNFDSEHPLRFVTENQTVE